LGRSQSVLKPLALALSVLVASAVGFAAGRAYEDAAASGPGRVIYGSVSSFDESTNVVCIRKDVDYCARLFRGVAPPVGTSVRGRLVEMPFDVDNKEPEPLWVYVTTLGS
jgi:hypothetical protein